MKKKKESTTTIQERETYAARVAFSMATMSAIILVIFWLAFSIIAWNFSVSPVAPRALLVVSALAGAVGYVVGEIIYESGMYSRMQDRAALSELDRRTEKLTEEANRVFEESREKKDQNIFYEWCKSKTVASEHQDIEWSRKKILSHRLIEEADRLHVPRPSLLDDEGKWDHFRPITVYGVPAENYPTIGYVLTPEAMVELRAAIREEKRKRGETAEWRVKIIGGLITIVTGLVGALIGLISVWKHR